MICAMVVCWERSLSMKHWKLELTTYDEVAVANAVDVDSLERLGCAVEREATSIWHKPR